jgi:hypothetical protein
MPPASAQLFCIFSLVEEEIGKARGVMQLALVENIQGQQYLTIQCAARKLNKNRSNFALEWYTSPVNIRGEGRWLQLDSLHDVEAETTTWTLHLISA